MSVSVVSPVFIGRREELASLTRLMTQARAGQPGFGQLSRWHGSGQRAQRVDQWRQRCSLVYGMQTVLLLLVARHAGLGLHGYGYLFAGIGVGALAGTALAGRAMRLPHPRAVLAAALAAVGLPMLMLPWASWGVLAIALAGTTGVGAILVEILTETSLQRSLPADVFGRAYGLALPASIGGIVAGSLVAPLLVSALGGTGAMVATGGAVVAYGLLLLRGAGTAGTAGPVPADAAAPAADLAEGLLVAAEA